MRNQAETLFASAVPASPNYLSNDCSVKSGQRAAFTQLPARCVTVFALSAALTPTQAHIVSLPMWGSGTPHQARALQLRRCLQLIERAQWLAAREGTK